MSPSPTTDGYISHSRHHTGSLHRESTSNRIEESFGRVWCVFGGLAHSSILPIKCHRIILIEKTSQLLLQVRLYRGGGISFYFSKTN